jgi:ComF family protein
VVAAIAANVLGELVGPSRCAACDVPVAPRVLFCPPCAASAERSDPEADVLRSDGDRIQGARARGSVRCLAAFEYGGAIATAITRLKYEDRADLAPPLALTMLETARRVRGQIDLVIPVPLHPRRLADRGYNQAALLGAPIARALDAMFAPRGLRRVRDTPRQASLDRAARLVNVESAFEARDRARVNGKRILVVDDVRTTGATLEGCAVALHEVGASSVVALVLARRA